MKKNIKRQGFTLVELLIVIIVIGILSAMMMLSSTEAVSSARAADIISDLRNMKTAALEWYADNIPYVEGKTADSSGKNFSKLSDEKSKIIKYLGDDALKAGYSFGDGADDETWYAWYKVTDARVLEKLKSRASTVGLVRQKNSSGTAGIDDLATYKVNTKNFTGLTIGLFIR